MKTIEMQRENYATLSPPTSNRDHQEILEEIPATKLCHSPERTLNGKVENIETRIFAVFESENSTMKTEINGPLTW